MVVVHSFKKKKRKKIASWLVKRFLETEVLKYHFQRELAESDESLPTCCTSESEFILSNRVGHNRQLE